MFALLIIGVVILAALVFLVIGWPYLLFALALLPVVIPLILLVLIIRCFSLGPLAVAILPVEKRHSGTRVVLFLMLVLVLSFGLVWAVGAVSIIGLSARPLAGIYRPLVGSVLERVGILWVDTTNILVFLTVGLSEVGLAAWALIGLVSSLFGWRQAAAYQRERLNGQIRLGYYGEKAAAGFVVFLSRALPTFGVLAVVVFPAVFGYAFPHLYTGGWSPLAKVPGMTTYVDVTYRNWASIFAMYPTNNWLVLFSRLPQYDRVVIGALLIVSGLNLFALITQGESVKYLSEEAAAEECQRIRRKCRNRSGDIICTGVKELTYAKALAAYANGEQRRPPEPAEFGLTREGLEERLAERERQDREWQTWRGPANN